MIISAEASGFPEFMREALKNQDFEIAKIPEIIKICHLLKEIENRKSSLSMQMSSIFNDNLELHKLMVSVTPTMWAYLHYILVNN